MLETNLLETPYGVATARFLNKRVRTSTTVLLDSCGQFTIGGVKMVIAITAINHGTGFESAGLSIGQFDGSTIGKIKVLDVDADVRREIRETLVGVLNEWTDTEDYADAKQAVADEMATDAMNGRGPDPCFG